MVLLLLALLVGCPSTEPVEEPPGEVITGIANLPGGDPLVARVASMPFPSDFFVVDDASTATGRRVAYPVEALPLDVAPSVVGGDGFSRATAMLTQRDGGFDPTSLPDASDVLATTRDDSPVFVLREGDWARHPLLVELDLGGNNPTDTALILRPHGAFEPDTGYVVLLRSSLRAADGGEIEATDAFRALRDGIATDSDAVEAWRPKFGLVNDAIAGAGLDPSEVVLGWSFHTRSREDVDGPLRAITDTLATLELDDVTITSDTVADDGDRRIEGTMRLPDFLGGDRSMPLEGGVPFSQGDVDVPFLVTIPDTIVGPRPVVLFGHGFFSSRYETTWGTMDDGLERWAMSGATIDFEGFSELDLADTAAVLTGPVEGLRGVINQQVQNVARFTALARVVKEQLSVDVAELDPAAVHYMGISNGGTQGLTIVATSPELSRGVLVVPGGGWTHMIQRAVQFGELGSLIQDRYPSPLDFQLVLAMLQAIFDPADSLNYADTLQDDPDVEVTLHMAVNDSQVANLVTEWVARTAGIPLIEPSTVVIPGLPTVGVEPEGRSALFVYDEGVPAAPPGNQPPLVDNGTHDSVRALDVYQEQVGTFLESGTIRQVCDGPCDPS
jgi:hypothetical protein